MAEHAILSASASHRWLNCTPSARLEQQFVEESASDYAAEGSLAHQFAETILRKYKGEITNHIYNLNIKAIKDHKLYTPEMDKEVEKYTNIVIEDFEEVKRTTPDAELRIEEKLILTEYIQEGFGTGDALIIADTVLKVKDLKYGKGVKVHAKENLQLMLYALGALAVVEMFYYIETIEISIVQPRLDHYSTWTISVSELKAWADKELKPKAIKAYAGEGLQQAGEWCQFCKASPRCATLAAVNMKTIDDNFSEPRLLKDKHLIDIYQKSDQIENWLKSVCSYMLKEALAGKKWDGLKVVEGRSQRKWKDEQLVIATLKKFHYKEQDFLKTKLEGIGAIEDLLGKIIFNNIMTDHIIKPKGAPTLVPLTDPRSDYSNIDDVFNTEDFL